MTETSVVNNVELAKEAERNVTNWDLQYLWMTLEQAIHLLAC